MLKRLREFFDQQVRLSQDDPADDEHRLRLATAALLFEMARQDEEVREVELDTIAEVVRAKFGLTAEETQELMAFAEQEVTESTDYHQFTSLINEAFTPAQKVKMVEHLWEVAWADGEVDRYEEHMVRKIADLLYVPHRDFIAAKHRAEPGGLAG